MNKEAARNTNNEIEQCTLEFLKYDLELLIGSDDLYSFFMGKNLSGITGCKGLNDLITELQKELSADSTDEADILISKRRIREDIDKKLQDVSFLSAVVQQALDLYKGNVERNRYSIISVNKPIKYALEEIEKFEKEVNGETYSVLLERQEKLKKCIESLNIDIEYDSDNEDYEGLWDYESLKAILEQKFDDSDNELQQFIVKYGSEKNVADTTEAIKKAVQEDIADLRNKIDHNQIDEKQYENEIRNRALSFKDHIFKWKPVYSISHKADRLDEFYSKAVYLYRKFDKNADVAITLGGHECGNISEMISAMSENWDLGVELLKANQSVPDIIKKESEILLPTYEILQSVVSAVKKQEQEKSIEEITEAKKRRVKAELFDTSKYDDYKLWYDACMFKFIYGIKPDYQPICWKGRIQEPEAFVKKNIFPLLGQKKYETVRKLVTNSGIDVLAEYGLISYYFQKKNDSVIGNNYDIEEIRDIELSILKLFKNDSNDRPLIPLYEVYEKLMDLAKVFGVSYEYYVKGKDRRISDKSELIEILEECLNIQDVDRAYEIINDNSFATLRGWLCSKYRTKENAVNDFFEWYLETCSYRRNISEVDDKQFNYYEMVRRQHSYYMPVSKLEMKCMVCYRFMKMLYDDGEALKNIAIPIRTYYCDKAGFSDISQLEPVANEGMREVIPFNTYRKEHDLEEKIPFEYTQYNAEESALIWDRMIIGRLSEVDKGRDEEGVDYKGLLLGIYNHMHNIIKQNPKDGQFMLRQYYERIKSEFYSRKYLLSRAICKYYVEKEQEITDECPEISGTPLWFNQSNISILKGIRYDLSEKLAKIMELISKLAELRSEFGEFEGLLWEEPAYIGKTANSFEASAEELEKAKAKYESDIANVSRIIKKKYIRLLLILAAVTGAIIYFSLRFK